MRLTNTQNPTSDPNVLTANPVPAPGGSNGGPYTLKVTIPATQNIEGDNKFVHCLLWTNAIGEGAAISSSLLLMEVVELAAEPAAEPAAELAAEPAAELAVEPVEARQLAEIRQKNIENTNNAPQGTQCCKIADWSLSVTPPSGNTVIVSGSVTSENCAASLNVPGNQAAFSGRLELRKPFPASLIYTNTGGMQLANQNYEVSYNSATQSLSLVNVVAGGAPKVCDAVIPMSAQTQENSGIIILIVILIVVGIGAVMFVRFRASEKARRTATMSFRTKGLVEAHHPLQHLPLKSPSQLSTLRKIHPLSLAKSP